MVTWCMQVFHLGEVRRAELRASLRANGRSHRQLRPPLALVSLDAQPRLHRPRLRYAMLSTHACVVSSMRRQDLVDGRDAMCEPREFITAI